MRFWFDTEFYEDGLAMVLISIGIVSEDGREYYAEVEHARLTARRTDWLKQNVLPHLHGGATERPLRKLANEIVTFVGDKPELWAYYADYDWVILCRLFGSMMDLPKGWPMYCRDVKQLCDSYGNPELPEQTSTEHHALADAKWAREAWQYLESGEFKRG